MDGDGQVTVRVVDSVAAIPAAEWDACAGADNPFLSHAFLSALEVSGSCSPDTGWLPQHLVAADEAGAVLGVVPAYLKSHSQGEYVFDHGWAEAYIQPAAATIRSSRSRFRSRPRPAGAFCSSPVPIRV